MSGISPLSPGPNSSLPSDISEKHKKDSSISVRPVAALGTKELKDYHISEINLKRYREAFTKENNFVELGIRDAALAQATTDPAFGKNIAAEAKTVEEQLQNAKESKEKIEILERAIKNAALPALAGSYELEEGRQYLLLGDPSSAITHLLHAENSTHALEARYLICVAFAMLGKWDSALGFYEDSLKNTSPDPLPEYWAPFQILFQPVVEMLKEEAFAKDWIQLSVEQKDRLFALYNNDTVPHLGLHFKALVALCASTNDSSTQIFDSFELIRKMRLDKVLDSLLPNDSEKAFYEEFRKISTLPADALIPFLELAAAHFTEAKKILADPRFHHSCFGFILINTQLTKLKNASVSIPPGYIERVLSYPVRKASHASPTDFLADVKFYAQFPHLYQRLKDRMAGLSPYAQNYLKQGLDLFTEENLEAFLDLLEKYPREISALLDEKVISVDEFHLLAPLFKNFNLKIRRFHTLQKEALAKARPEDRQKIIDETAKIDATTGSILSRVKNYFVLLPTTRMGGYITSLSAGCLAYSVYPSLFHLLLNNSRSLPPPTRGLTMEEVDILTDWYQKPDYLATPFITQFVRLIDTPNFQGLSIAALALVHKFPLMIEKIFELAKNVPELLISLYNLSNAIPRADCEFLINRYVANRWVDGKWESDLTPAFINGLLKELHNTTSARHFNQLLECERKAGNAFIIKIPGLLSLLKTQAPLLQVLATQSNVARQIDADDLTGCIDWRNDKAAALLYDVTEVNSQARSKYAHAREIWQTGLPSTPVSRVYQVACKLNDAPSQRPLVAALNTLVAAGEAALAERLLAISDLNLLLVAATGEIALVKKLLDMPSNAMSQRLRAQLNVDTIPVVRGIVRLLPEMPSEMVKLISQNNGPFTPVERTLLSLAARGEKRLLEHALSIIAKPMSTWSHNEQRWIEWITVSGNNSPGHYALAKDFLDNPSDSFWKEVMQTPLSINLIQQMRNLHKNLFLMARPPHSWPQDFIDRMSHAIFEAARKNPSAAEGIVSVYMHCLTQYPEIARKLIDPNVSQLHAKITKEIIEDLFKMLTVPLPTNELVKRIAGILVTPAGTINQSFITNLLDLLNSSDNPNIPHLRRVLEILNRDHSFSDRLECLTLPPEGSRQYAIIKTILGIPEAQHLTLRDAQIAVISALLFPLRQSTAGSCFATSICLQLDSSQEGLRQSFEDYCSLIQHGSLRRRDEQSQKEYPMTYDRERFHTLFSDDSLLSRIREFTYASLSRPNKELYSAASNALKTLYTHRLEAFKKMLNTAQLKMFGAIETQVKAMIDRMSQDLHAGYLGYASSPGEPQLGAWIFYDPLTNEPLIKGREFFEFYLLKILHAHALALKDPDEQMAAKAFGAFLAEYVQSDEFHLAFFNVRDVASLPFSSDLTRLPKSPLSVFQGGYIDSVVAAVEPGTTVGRHTLPKRRHLLESLCFFVQNLHISEREAARKNPFLLRTIVTPTHAMNIRLGDLLSLIDRAGGADALIKRMEGSRKAILDLRVTPELQKRICESVLSALPLDSALKTRLGKQLAAASPAPSDIKKLCRLIYQKALPMLFNTPHAPEIILYAIQAAVMSDKEIHGQMPEYCTVFDTNWGSPSSIAIGPHLLSGLNGLFYTQAGLPRFVREASIHPLALSAMTTLEYHPHIDEFSRSYADLTH